jgi:hypothetical protein
MPKTEQELAGLDAEFDVLDWDADPVAQLPSGPRTGSDAPYTGSDGPTADLTADLVSARAPLTPGEVQRYRALGASTAAALTDACGALRPDTTEYAAAGLLAHELMRRELDPVVLLVAGQERLPLHRHPVPTREPVRGLAMLVVCARRGGLIASATRLVALQPLDPQVRAAHARLLDVETEFLSATRPGARVGDVFDAGVSAYARHGFSPQEWKNHHQGGPTGYAPRDPIARSGSDAAVALWQAFAWNPSAPGVKTEDTLLAAPGGQEVVTVDDRWPTTEVSGRARPRIWERA